MWRVREPFEIYDWGEKSDSKALEKKSSNWNV